MSSERQLIENEGRWLGEHIHRYNEALKHIKPTDVVFDIACGTGFGTDILAGHTTGKVIGGDISPEAILECKDQWKRSNLDFQVVDGTNLNFPNNHFDVIVSFETIEHTTAYAKMLTEFKRVLKPGGRLLLSTPNAAITSPNGVIRNPYHTQEFRHQELSQILAGMFQSPEIYGQRYIRYEKATIRKRIGSFFEHLMLSVGIGKIPYPVRSNFMKIFFGYPLYPKPEDYLLENDEQKIIKQAPVLFAVCKK